MTGDDLYAPGLRPRPIFHHRPIHVHAQPRHTSWWTVAETGEQFTSAAAHAHQQRQRDRRGIKTPDREWYR